MIVADPDIHQGPDAETIYYTEDKWIGNMLPEETTDDPIPQVVLNSLARINSHSPSPQDDELLPEINQSNERKTITINDDNDDDIDFTISHTTVEIRNNNDNDKITFAKQTAQHPSDM